MAEACPELAGRFHAVLDGYDRVIDRIVSQPRTLVHGGYRPPNILLATDGSARVMPVDWETAGYGPMFLDLAFFTDGFQPPELDRLWGAYRTSAERAGVDVPADDAIRRGVDDLRLHRVMRWLSHGGSRRAPRHKVVELVERAEWLSTLVSG